MARARPGSHAPERRPAVPGVTRTCVGCRKRASVTELIRVVAVVDGTDTVLRPDPRRSATGRGAHLHLTTACLDLAERRRALGRALRSEGVADAPVVRRFLEERAVWLAEPPDHP